MSQIHDPPTQKNLVILPQLLSLPRPSILYNVFSKFSQTSSLHIFLEKDVLITYLLRKHKYSGRISHLSTKLQAYLYLM
jgi:hypothetical protein